MLISAILAGSGAIFYGSSESLAPSQYVEIRMYHNRNQLKKDTFRVMTYNIGYLSGMTNNLPVKRERALFSKNLNSAAQLINTSKPDIIGFQEIDFNSDRTYGFNQLDSLAILCDYNHAASIINWDKKYVPFPFWPPSMHFAGILSGQSILTNGTITQTERVVLPRPESKSFLYNAFYIDRIIQITKLRLTEYEIYVMNVHLEAFDQRTREKQGKIVRSYFEKLSSKYPVLLIGDFNAEPFDLNNTTDSTMAYILGSNDIKHAYDKASYEANPTHHYTFSSEDPRYKIDYILYNPSKIQPVHYEVMDEAKYISDHLPVQMDFVLLNAE